MAVHEQAPELAACFGRNLWLLRRRADYSQEDLSGRAALHRTEIGLLENGKRMPRLDTIIQLAGAMELEPCGLLDGMAWTPEGHKQGRFYLVDGRNGKGR